MNIEINPGAFFTSLSQIALGQAEEDWPVLMMVDHLGGNEEAGLALHDPALRMLTAAAEMVTILATREWGNPEFTYAGGRKKLPKWMELYLYPNGVPISLHYLAGWRREQRKGKRRQEIAAFAFIDESDGGRPGWWQLRLSLGWHDFQV